MIPGNLSSRGFSAVIAGLFAIVVFPLVYLAFARNLTVLDERGIAPAGRHHNARPAIRRESR